MQGAFIKFGNLHHLQTMQNDGLLYMNPIQYFWDIDDDNLRGDLLDSLKEYHKGSKAELIFNDNLNFKPTVKSWDLKIHADNYQETNLFCMYALKPDTCPIPIKNYEFGNYALLILYPDKFMDQIVSSIRKQKLNLRAELVSYVSDNHTGKIGSFVKLNKYKYQSEWRMQINNGNGKPRKFHIGNISDISLIVKTSELSGVIEEKIMPIWKVR